MKQFIAPFLLDPEAHLAEPVRFELLRSARPKERRQQEAQFATLPTLPARICGSGRSPWARLHPGLAMVRRGICAAPAMADSHLANRSQFKGLRSRCRSILRSLSCPIECLLRKALRQRSNDAGSFPRYGRLRIGPSLRIRRWAQSGHHLPEI